MCKTRVMSLICMYVCMDVNAFASYTAYATM